MSTTGRAYFSPATRSATGPRGRMVSLSQMAVTVGIFVAYWADYLLISSDGWRLMLGISAVPAVLLVVAILPLRDSATCYVKVGRRGDAEAVLRRAEPGSDAAAQSTTSSGPSQATCRPAGAKCSPRPGASPLSLPARLPCCSS